MSQAVNYTLHVTIFNPQTPMEYIFFSILEIEENSGK